jgi:hypothetical protein
MFLYKNIAQKNNSISRAVFLSLVSLVVFFTTAIAYAADISLSPTSGTYQVGKTFTVDVSVSNNTEAVNAVSGTLSYPPDLLSIKSFSKSGSVITLWPSEPSYSNADGTFKFEGAILNPGFSEAKGKVISVTFLVKAEGKAALSFSDGQVLANDGNATNIVNKLGSANYTLTSTSATPATPVSTTSAQTTPTAQTLTIISSSYPDQSAWYSNKNAAFSWNVPDSVTAVRTLYSNDAFSVPSKVYTPAIAGKTFTVDSDGVQYMHVQAKTADGWGPIAHYKFQIDTQAPTDLAVTFPEGDSTANPAPIIKVTAYDPLSGVASLDFAIDGEATTTYPVNDTGLYTLASQESGTHTGIVLVKDKAGNVAKASFTFTTTQIKAPEITDYTKHAVVGDVLKVEGTTYPNGTVEVTYSNTNDNKTYTKTIASDADGAFTMLWSDELPAGVYEMKARVIDSHGAKGVYSVPRVLNLEQHPYIQIGLFVMNWLSLILILILAGTCIAAAAWYSLTQFGRWKRKTNRTIREVENTLKTNVQALRRDLEDFRTILVKAEKKRELTKEELVMLRKFDKRIEIAEKEIEEKLEQIG